MKTTSNLIPILVTTLIFLFQNTTLTAQCTGNQRIDAAYSILGNDICEGGEITVANFTNEFGHSNVFYVWDWGDGTVDTVFNQSDVTHIYNFPEEDACSAGGFRTLELRLDAFVQCGSRIYTFIFFRMPS